uniref:RNase III domain-containing protein n=1 Tax=viral metagenome TaxID=1070528 RepID=A0A6C0C5G0_9ZZZZ
MEFTTKTLLQDGDINKHQEELIFDPYNSRNIEITETQVSNILKKYGVPDTVHNFKLYVRSFVHRSYVKRPHLENEKNGITIVDKPNDCLPLKTKSNERLEFLGDGVLECITKYYLYRRFPKENEGFMTEKKIALVRNESIGRMAYEMGLNNWYILSKNAEEKKTRTNLKKLGCLFEAFLGALFLDFNKITIKDEDDWFKNVFVTGPGFQIAQTFVENVFEKHVNWTELLQKDDNYKNILQVMLQKEFKLTPSYMEISDHDDDEGYHMGVFLCIGKNIVNVNFNDSKPFSMYGSFDKIQQELENKDNIVIFLGEGKHKIKKKAEQTACRLAIEEIKKK